MLALLVPTMSNKWWVPALMSSSGVESKVCVHACGLEPVVHDFPCNDVASHPPASIELVICHFTTPTGLVMNVETRVLCF